jgi:hypothetical protein
MVPATLRLSVGVVTHWNSSTACPNNELFVEFETRSSTGSLTDLGFTFAIYGPGCTQSISPRPPLYSWSAGTVDEYSTGPGLWSRDMYLLPLSRVL